MSRQPDIAEVIAAREALRPMIREAHEAIKDLRAAQRDLAAARKAIVTEVKEGLAHLQAALNKVVAEQSADAQREFAKMIQHIQANSDKVVDHQARLLGAADSKEMLHMIITELIEALIEQQDRWLPPNIRVRKTG